MTHDLVTDASAIGAETAFWRDAAITGLFAGLASILVLAALPGARDARALAVVYPPWTSAQQALRRSWDSGLTVLRQGVHPSVVIVANRQDEGLPLAKPDGAWLMLSLDGLAGCLDAGTPEPIT